MSTENQVTTDQPFPPELPPTAPAAPGSPGEQDPLVNAGPADGRRRPRWLDWRIGLAVLLGVLGLLAWHHYSGPARALISTSPEALPTVAVVSVERRDLFNEVTRYAEFRPYVEVELHAKVSGYVQEINVDFGDRVTKGQLLATLEVPELQDQLRNALAFQRKVEADYTTAHLYYTRLAQTAKDNPGGVAQQDVDAARAKEGAAEAAIAAAKAEVDRYQTLTVYTKIVAPFDGVVTKRYVDQGALIQAGTTSETQSLPLVRISDNYRLRLDLPIDLEYVKDVHVGDTIDVRVDSLGKTLSGAITRTTMKINQETRTMIIEIEVPNPTLELVPGMYAVATLKLQRRPQVLAIPIEAVSGETNKTVYAVDSGNRIEERVVTTGLETPDHYEVLTGLHEGDRVMIGARMLVQPGEKVNPRLKGAGTEPGAAQ